MKKIFTTAFLIAALAGAATAHAQVSGGIVISNSYRGHPQYGGAVYVQQPPVYYRPAPVYYYPRPVMAPPPVYYAPPRYHHHRDWGYRGYYPYYGHRHHRHDDD
jgi:hypothetical protein